MKDSYQKEFFLGKIIVYILPMKYIGNGVPYLASKAIAQTILDFLATTERQDALFPMTYTY